MYISNSYIFIYLLLLLIHHFHIILFLLLLLFLLIPLLHLFLLHLHLFLIFLLLLFILLITFTSSSSTFPSSSQSEKRNIEDNILLLVQSEDVIRSNGEVALLVEELGGLDCTSFVNQRQKLERKYSALKEEVYIASHTPSKGRFPSLATPPRRGGFHR